MWRSICSIKLEHIIYHVLFMLFSLGRPSLFCSLQSDIVRVSVWSVIMRVSNRIESQARGTGGLSLFRRTFRYGRYAVLTLKWPRLARLCFPELVVFGIDWTGPHIGRSAAPPSSSVSVKTVFQDGMHQGVRHGHGCECLDPTWSPMRKGCSPFHWRRAGDSGGKLHCPS